MRRKDDMEKTGIFEMSRLKRFVKGIPIFGKTAVSLYRMAIRMPYKTHSDQIKQLDAQMKFMRLNVQNIALALTPLEQERYEIESAEELRNLHTTSTLCTQDQFMTPEYLYWCKRIKEEPVWHRKQWEYYFISQALWERGMLSKGRRGLGFGVGKEPLPALFANFGCKILATDAPATETIIEQWQNTGQYASSLEDLNIRRIAPEEVFYRNMSFQPVDMNNMPADLTGFDFIWSSCAMEHLGSISQGIRFIVNSSRCLKLGGIGVHTTEFNISSNKETIERGSTVLFRQKDIEEMSAKLRKIGCRMLRVDFDQGEGLLDKFLAVPPYYFTSQDLPMLKLVVGGFVTTSIALIVQKNRSRSEK